MNICLLNLDYRPFRTAGLTVYGELLADGLVAAGNQVTFVSARREQAPATETIDGVEVHRVSVGATDWLGFGAQAARLLRHLQKKRQFDVVHFLDVRFAWAYRGECIASVFETFQQRLHAKGGLPYAHSWANLAYRYAYFSFVRVTLESWALAHPVVLIAASEAARAELVNSYSVGPERIVLVPLGIPVERYERRDSRELRSRLGLQDKHVILYVGFSTPRKGVEYLIEALQRLGPDCVLILVGKWEPGYRARFERLLPASLRERVLTVGYVPDQELPLYYSLADVFVFPSLLEGFGLPVVEAMACGTPVIAANASSLPEVVGDAGILVPPMDSVALAAALGRVLADDELRAVLASRGQARARLMYSQQAMVDKTVAVYRAYPNGCHKLPDGSDSPENSHPTQ